MLQALCRVQPCRQVPHDAGCTRTQYTAQADSTVGTFLHPSDRATPSVGALPLPWPHAGNRIQVHRVGDAVHYFSRARNEHGEMSSYSVFDGVVRDQLNQPRVILDCEIIIWNKTRRAAPKHCPRPPGLGPHSRPAVSDAAPLGLRHPGLADAASCALHMRPVARPELSPDLLTVLGLCHLTHG